MFSLGSRMINVLTGGSAEMSFSARSHRDGLWTEQYIDRLFYVLRKEKDHCRVWYEYDVQRARQTIADFEIRSCDNWDIDSRIA